MKIIYLIILILTLLNTLPAARDFDLPLLAKKLKSACVTIRVLNERMDTVNQGSGFFVSPTVVVTLGHVLWKKNKVNANVWFVTNDREHKLNYAISNVLFYDNMTDIIIVDVYSIDREVREKQRYLNVTNNFLEGEDIVVVSSPLDIEGVISCGIISKIHDSTYFQISNPISTGSSGAPIVNNKGEVIGIVHGSMTKGQNLNVGVVMIQSSFANLSDIQFSEPRSYQEWVQWKNELSKSGGLLAVFTDTLKQIPAKITNFVKNKIKPKDGLYMFQTAVPKQAISDTATKRSSEQNNKPKKNTNNDTKQKKLSKM